MDRGSRFLVIGAIALAAVVGVFVGALFVSGDAPSEETTVEPTPIPSPVPADEEGPGGSSDAEPDDVEAAWHPPGAAERTEAGAVAAAISTVRDTSAISGEEVWGPAVDTRVSGRPADIEAFRKNLGLATQLLLEEDLGAIEDPNFTWPSGHRVVRWSPIDAEIDVFITDADDDTLSLSIRMVWEDDRWKMVAPTDGIWGPAAKAVE